MTKSSVQRSLDTDTKNWSTVTSDGSNVASVEYFFLVPCSNHSDRI